MFKNKIVVIFACPKHSSINISWKFECGQEIGVGHYQYRWHRKGARRLETIHDNFIEFY